MRTRSKATGSKATKAASTAKHSKPAAKATKKVRAAKTKDKQMEQVQEDERLQRLKDLLLSPACCTEAFEEEGKEQDVELLDPPVIAAMLRQHVPDFDSMLDRTGTTPILEYIVSTYLSGLPALRGSPEVLALNIKAIRTIFARVKDLEAADAKTHLTRLCDAFTACQAVQGRVIDSIYGQLTGRDRGFKDQLLVLVDEQKQRVLDEVTIALNPGCEEVSDAHPSRQIPHIQNGYRRAIGEQLGLRGLAQARADFNAPNIAPKIAAKVADKFRELFSMQELLNSIVGDVNQQNPQAERYIDRNALAAWANGDGKAKGFDPYRIYFNEDEADKYNDARPTEENAYQPFLHPGVALDVLATIFL